MGNGSSVSDNVQESHEKKQTGASPAVALRKKLKEQQEVRRGRERPETFICKKPSLVFIQIFQFQFYALSFSQIFLFYYFLFSLPTH